MNQGVPLKNSFPKMAMFFTKQKLFCTFTNSASKMVILLQKPNFFIQITLVSLL